MIEEHPSFTRARNLPDPWCSHFPKSREDALAFVPYVHHKAIASRVLVVAKTRAECAWAAYVDAVPGHNHDHEWQAVLDHGDKLDEPIARAMFPRFAAVPYAH